MNWPELIHDLTSAGMKQTEIAVFAGVNQSTISDLARGRIKDTSFEIGDKLRALHKRVMRRSAKQKQEA